MSSYWLSSAGCCSSSSSCSFMESSSFPNLADVGVIDRRSLRSSCGRAEEVHADKGYSFPMHAWHVDSAYHADHARLKEDAGSAAVIAVVAFNPFLHVYPVADMHVTLLHVLHPPRIRSP